MVFMTPKRLKTLWALVIAAIVMYLFGLNSGWVEMLYSQGIYKQISLVQRRVFGIFPFSIGDVLYGFAAVFLLWKLVFFMVKIFKTARGERKKYFVSALISLATGALVVYLIFNLLWGLNYNRPGVQVELGIKPEQYSKADLVQINELLLQKVNDSRKTVADEGGFIQSPDSVFAITKKAVANAALSMPFLNTPGLVIKSSLWGWLGNSAGFTGYYNPFTGEAQVNTDYPAFVLPYVSCHELAHQSGYAKEMEANFVGYLTAIHANNPAFNYSVYFDLFMYANRNLYFTDSSLALNLRNSLDTLVKQDMTELRNFMDRHSNFTEPLIRWVYTMYLKGNRQPEGMLSYDKVTGFIIGYYKKFGKI